ncbi:MAG: MFS transporter [Betaproteobacteria bacterium RIFCSPLOWO2_02_FULL_66_14]|nr:MAG: MFS transporter [Betaproteobacteria bacterium RIFCSPLOWO2_02_FULL_66_14]
MSEPESRYAWGRLAAALALMTLGGSGMYAVTVVLPLVQAEFGASRADASLPYTLTLIGFGVGSILMGRLSDRFGVLVPALAGSLCLGAGFVAAGFAQSLWQFALIQGLAMGLLGSSGTFAPLVADISLWFNRRRGIAVAICASGNYLAGSLWPPVLQHFFDGYGWRASYIGAGVFIAIAALPLTLALRRRAPVPGLAGAATSIRQASPQSLGLSSNSLFVLLCIAGVSCCVAMSMPQVHIVAYCSDLGFAAARGAEMLSVMLASGIVSRLISGWICDRIGGLRTLLLGASLQAVALLLFLPFDGLVALYVVAALFGLFQGGIVPSYAIIVREHFPVREAGWRVGSVLTATLFGMALGGWLSGAIFDATGSYRAAFLNGVAWNLVTIIIAAELLRRKRHIASAQVV